MKFEAFIIFWIILFITHIFCNKCDESVVISLISMNHGIIEYDLR